MVEWLIQRLSSNRFNDDDDDHDLVISQMKLKLKKKIELVYIKYLIY